MKFQDIDETHAADRTYAAEQFATQQGERWRRFLERVGTRGGPASSISTRMPSSVSCLATQPPLAPDPTITAS